jgi:hypothetical protein
MEMLFAPVHWRRLDTEGQSLAGFALESPNLVLCGGDSWTQDGQPTWTNYTHSSIPGGKFLNATIDGWLNKRFVQAKIVRTAENCWILNGSEQPGLEDLTDLDFGFTPATNYFQLRRLGEELGVRRELPVVWWDLGETRLIRLPQFYTRHSATTAWYESPSMDTRHCSRSHRMGLCRAIRGCGNG